MAVKTRAGLILKTIGLNGGCSLNELGSVADVQLFFDCIKAFAIPAFPENDWSILTDRLYRRYLRIEELGPAQVMMDHLRELFMTIPSSAVDWGGIAALSSVTRLDPSKSTLADVFSEYFGRFSHCRESAVIFFETWKEYQPVKIVVSDIPAFTADKKRRLEEYDTLEGKPFWK